VAIGNYVTGLIERNRLNEAGRELEKIASIYPDTYADYKGELAAVGGKWANEVLGSLEALRFEPGGAMVYGWLVPAIARIGLGQEALTISEHYWPEILIMLGRPGEAVTEAEKRLAEDPTRLWSRRDLGLTLAVAGDFTRARPFLEEMWQRNAGRVNQTGLFLADHAAALIAIRRNAGEEAVVGELLAAIRDNVLRYREAGMIRADYSFSADYEEGLATYLSGEREKGLALIAKAVEDGYFILPKAAYLQTLYDDPGFAPILASQEARQARERNRFLAIVCTDNPYEEVWQPAEGTCERFAAEGGN
jgi:hypothetical protein